MREEEPVIFTKIFEGLKNEISLSDTHRCIDKLINDGFVGQLKMDKVYIGNLNLKLGNQSGEVKSAESSTDTYYITLEGRDFLKSGGYKGMRWQFWRWRRFWTEIFFPALTIILTILNVFITKNNSDIERDKKALNKKITELEKQVYNLSKNKSLIQNFYVLSDSLKQKNIQAH